MSICNVPGMTTSQPRRRVSTIETGAKHDQPSTIDSSADVTSAASPGITLSSRWPALLLLLTGTSLTTVSQFLSNAGVAQPSAQLVSWVKYASSLAANISAYRAQKGSAVKLTRTVKLLLGAVGVLDVIAYALFVAGFSVLGSSLSTTLFAACGQIFTALFTVLCLRRPLSGGQITAVVVVWFGLLLRGVSWSVVEDITKGALLHSVKSKVDGGSVIGLLCIVGSSIGYSLLGVAYDALLQQPNPPPHSTIMTFRSLFGFSLTTLYQLLYTLPRWHLLVLQPMYQKGTSLGWAAVLLTMFASIFNVHTYVQSLVYRREGAVGVGVVHALRGATVSVVSASIFCTPATPSQCLTPWSASSAAVVTCGVAMWIMCKVPTQQGKTKKIA